MPSLCVEDALLAPRQGPSCSLFASVWFFGSCGVSFYRDFCLE